MKLQVNVLLCKDHVGFAIPCLKSFIARSEDDVALHIFDDGSLGERDCFALSHEFEDLMLHRFNEYYGEISEGLRKYPACLKYRKDSPYALKLLDLPLSSPSTFLNLDSDIYFFKNFKGLNRATIEDPDYVGARDLITHCYGLNLQERYLNKKIPLLPDRLNSGFIYMNKRIYDLDLIEWLLKDLYEVKGSYFPRVTEQYVLAGLAAKNKSFVWDRNQVKIQNPYSVVKTDGNTVAIHFYHGVRHMLVNHIDNDDGKRPEMNEKVQRLILEPVTYHSLLHSAFERVVEKFIFRL
jgi:hypothetical protein